MMKDGTWVDDIFVQATALYLDLPIYLVIADSATHDRPVAPIQPEPRRAGSAEGPPLWIGYISDKHYQSLLPREGEPSTSKELTLHALRTTLDQIQLDPPVNREKSEGGPHQPTIDSPTFVHSMEASTTNHSGDPPGPVQPTFSDISSHNLSTSSTSIVWPTLLNFPTEFENGWWKCPLCSETTPRIRQHLTKSHKGDIKDWRAV